QALGSSDRADWARGGPHVAVAARRIDWGWFRDSVVGDTAREGGAFGDDGEDRSQRCPRDRTINPDGVVSSRSRQVPNLPGGAGAVSARKQLQGKLVDMEVSIRWILRGFGLKIGKVTRKEFEARVREMVAGQAMLERIAAAMLSARATVQNEFNKLHKAMLS